MAKKRSYKQSEVTKLLDIQPYVLRYWETEFPFLRVSKPGGGQRTFSAEEVDLLGRIRTLLYQEGYTIAGARKRIEAEQSGAVEAPAPEAAETAKSEALSAPADADRLRAGIAEALSQARAILKRLDG